MLDCIVFVVVSDVRTAGGVFDANRIRAYQMHAIRLVLQRRVTRANETDRNRIRARYNAPS